MFPLISAPRTFAVIISTIKLITAETPRVKNVLAILLNTYFMFFDANLDYAPLIAR